MIWVLFLAGPVIWITHFMGVYVLAEAVCAAGGVDVRAFGIPLLSLVTLVATALAVAAVIVLAVRAFRVWRADPGDPPGWLPGGERDAGLALAGWLLGILFAVAILFTGIPAAFLEPC